MSAEGAASARHICQRVEAPHGWRVGTATGALIMPAVVSQFEFRRDCR
jgi:hypothetical protein